MFSPTRQFAAICFAAVMIIVGIEQPCAQSDTSRSESSVIELETGDNLSRAVERKLMVEVGDSTRAQFEPSFELTGWAGQVGFRVGLATISQPLTSAIRQVTVRNEQPMTRLIGNTCEHELYVRDDGNFEWNLVLYEEPDDPVLRYPINMRGLTISYQDTLTDEETANGAVRPDSVIGSYAAYHATGRGSVRHGINYLSRYGCGKAFHIYRPRVWDASGDSVWAAVAIDTTVDSLSLILDGHWLADVTYPVTVDPTFGTTAVGGSAQGVGVSDVLHCQYTSASETGSLDSITWYLQRPGSQPNVGYAMYESKPGYVACSLLVDTSTSQYGLPVFLGGQWYGLEMAESASIAANTEYWLSIGTADNSCNTYYDDTDADSTAGHQDDPWPFDSPCNSGWLVYATNRTYSVYATFTCDNCDAATRRRRRLLGGN